MININVLYDLDAVLFSTYNILKYEKQILNIPAYEIIITE